MSSKPTNSASKKRETTASLGNNYNGKASKKKKIRSATAAAAERDALRQATGYIPLSLSDIHDQVMDLCRRLPPIPDGGFALPDNPTTTPTGSEDDARNSENHHDQKSPARTKATSTTVLPQPTVPCRVDKIALKQWAATTQALIEEYSFVVSNVSVATYKWGTDRSGAADQNLSLLGNELARSQELLTSRLAPRLNDILCPVVTTVTAKTVTTKQEDGTEVRENFYVHSYEDVDYVQMCFNSLARNAPHLRHLLLANWDKVLNAISDYQLAQNKDNESSRGLY